MKKTTSPMFAVTLGGWNTVVASPLVFPPTLITKTDLARTEVTKDKRRVARLYIVRQ